MRNKETAAILIQYWWRKKLREQLKIAERAAENARWQGLTRISLRNDELVEKLKKLQMEKNIDLTKYETILNRPARDVPMLLRCPDKSFLRENAEDIIKEKMLKLKRDKAARVLQRTFRKYTRNQIRSQFEKKILKITPKRRLELMAEIRDRLEKSKTVQTSSLNNLKSQIITGVEITL
ncbi:unnamed protein product [Auanema sp. JU1783]|nr:unnamed protein product [Auanema sp. JU1783]